MRNDTIDTYLMKLGSRVPAPGGGAVAALHAAQAAALTAMVAHYTSGPKYAEHAETVNEVTVAAETLVDEAVDLAEKDAEAFTVVTQAYRLPKDTEAQASVRSRAIAAALVDAALVPARTIATAARALELAESLLPIGNRNVISDVAAAADAARAAASTARVNVEINLGGLRNSLVRAELLEVLADVDDLLLRADKVTAAVREVVAR